MKTKKTFIIFTLAIMFFTSNNSYSEELSSNPWAVQNSNSAIENAYQKRRKARIIKNQETQNPSDLDTSSAYKSRQAENNEDFLDGIKNFFKKDSSNNINTQQNIQDTTQSQIEQRRKSLSRGRFAKKSTHHSLPQKSNSEGFFSMFSKKPASNDTSFSLSGKKKSSSSSGSGDLMKKLKQSSKESLDAIRKQLK